MLDKVTSHLVILLSNTTSLTEVNGHYYVSASGSDLVKSTRKFPLEFFSYTRVYPRPGSIVIVKHLKPHDRAGLVLSQHIPGTEITNGSRGDSRPDDSGRVESRSSLGVFEDADS